MNHDERKSSPRLLSLVLLALGLTAGGCDFARKPTAAVSTQEVGAVTSADEVASGGTAAIRNFTQLRASMSAVTGVLPGNGQVSQYYNSVRSRLSPDGNSEGVSPSMLLAITGLAGVHCRDLVTSDKSKAEKSIRVIFTDIDFTKNQDQLTPELRTALFQTYARTFWRREATEEELEILSDLLEDASTGRTKSTAEMEALLVLSCTAALSSLDFIKS